ncbi:hypothetical protein AGOR_G00117880 [Albula goreensis]|uniref:PAS domain-containing protein n=1 Tax=Albula goreensis TaxID=1534307 RepID=A0A8T3DFU7_9TELE|nr:hypothetical protein AGOR_G00117880 [Albula goreensis]
MRQGAVGFKVRLKCKTLVLSTALYLHPLPPTSGLPDTLKMVLHRSTKGASKARRDHINSEIRNMRNLLPIPSEEKERLSYLHSMAAICIFIRKSIIYPEFQVEGHGCPLPYEDFLPALPGFIIAMTREGKLIYVSENVVDYLGYSMVDILQGDSFYDMVESADVEVAKSHLEAVGNLATEFVCQMHMSKPLRLRQGSSSCSMLVSGRFQAIPQSFLPRSDLSQAFVALCTPTADQLCDSNAQSTMGHFESIHQLDMTYHQVSDSVLFHLGYSEEEMIGRSWYSLLHPDDLTLSTAGHQSLQQGNAKMVLRLQCKNLSWVWLYIQATREASKQTVYCTNYVISKTEATFLSQKIYSDISGAQRSSPPDSSQPLVSCDPECHYEANQACDSSPPALLRDVPILPTALSYSPDSTHSPTLQESRSSDLLLDSYSSTEDFLSPQESSSPYENFLSAEESTPTYPSFHGSHLSSCELFQPISDQTFHLSNLGVVSSHSSESPYGFPVCPTDACVVPDFLPQVDPCRVVSDVSFHPEDFSLQVQHPEGTGPFLSPHSTVLMTPDPSPTTESGFQYSQEEQVEISILAQQISSLASSFHVYHSQSPAPRLSSSLHSAYSKASTVDSPALPPQETLHPMNTCSHPIKPELVLDEDIIDSILKQLGQVSDREGTTFSRLAPTSHSEHTCRQNALEVQDSALAITTLVDKHPSTLTLLDPGTITSGCHEDAKLTSGCHGDTNELYQLNQYLCSSFKQDGLVEESMY